MIATKYFMTVTKQVNDRRIEQYRRNIRTVIRGLWSGVLDFDQAFESMTITVERRLTEAWEGGARECDISPDELSSDEKIALTRRINGETGQIVGFLEAIEENDRANGGKLTPLFSRVDLWVNRYKDVFNQAMEMACEDQKLIWQLGATEEHCRTCPRLHGKVKRASFWQKSGIHPQRPPNNMLECGGWKCLCTLERTNSPISKGPLPRN